MLSVFLNITINSMLHTYFPILVLGILAAGFLVTMLLLSVFLGPKKSTEVKDEPFECGTIGSGSADERCSVKFYLVAMLFILFDIELVFLYPWATQVGALGWYAFWAMIGFLAILSVGLVYICKRGVLDWS